MQRIKIEIAYDGTRYHGWQRQTDQPSIQETIEKNIAKITGEHSAVTGSGRTDAGVHALKQVAAFTTKSTLTPDVFQRALNGLLPHDIRIRHAGSVPLSFHPINHAVSKRYRYLIDDQQPNCPVMRNYCWGYREPLDIAAMQEAAKDLLGTHDFACFQTQGSPRRSTVRTVSDVLVRRQTDSPLLPPLIQIEIEADGFLYNMVRAIAGTFVLIGAAANRKTKRHPPAPICIQELIESKDRTLAGPTAPPHGLYLINVIY